MTSTEGREAERFVGRVALLTAIREALAGTRPTRLLYVHGPGGIGKSALLRAAGRVAASAGHPVLALDGRTLAPDPDAIADALEGADPSGLVTIDELDALEGLRFAVRDALLARVPSTAVVVLAGRAAPGREWFDAVAHGTVEPAAVDVRLSPLDPAEAATLATALGVTDPDEVDALVRWSHGFPLALAVAAGLSREDGSGEGPTADPAPVHLDDEVADRLVRRLSGHELAGVDADVLDVAAIASRVDARLLAAALPGRPTRDGLTRLRALSVAEVVGGRVTLHRLLRQALRSRLVGTDPDRYRALVLRVAEHLAQRAASEDQRLALELADLVEDPGLRLAWEPSGAWYADRLRPGDLERVEAIGPEAGWYRRLVRWCEDEPATVLVVRRPTGEAASITVINRGDRLPPWTGEDLELGPMVEHARANGRLSRAAFMHKIAFLAPDLDAAAIAQIIQVGNSAALTRGLTGDLRYPYVTVIEQHDEDGTEMLGYVEVPELRRRDGDVELLTFANDFGPGGVVGAMHAMVRAEQGADDGGDDRGRATELVVALRSFHDDEVLAALTLAHGPEAPADVAGRAALVRDEVRHAVASAFGPDDADRARRGALERTYLDPDGGHARARDELHMSRSSFYRHLQRAREQLARSAG